MTGRSKRAHTQANFKMILDNRVGRIIRFVKSLTNNSVSLLLTLDIKVPP